MQNRARAIREKGARRGQHTFRVAAASLLIGPTKAG